MEQYEAARCYRRSIAGEFQVFFTGEALKKYRTEVLYNWTSLEEKNIPASRYREKFGLQDKIVFFYGGTSALPRIWIILSGLAESLHNEPEAHFLLVGDGSEADRLNRIISRKRLSNIMILDAVDQAEYLAMLSEFDIGLISLDRKLKTHNFPGKMLGYMYHSLPILASINPENDLKEIIEKMRPAWFR